MQLRSLIICHRRKTRAGRRKSCGREGNTITRVYTKLKPFGCAAWVLNLRQDRGKFDQKSELQVCLNYNPDSHTYGLLSIPQGRISESAHVVFNVDYFPMTEKNTTDKAPQHSMDPQDFDFPTQEHERPTRDRTPSAQALRNLAAK